MLAISAWLLAICGMLAFPLNAQAHAVLVRSDPSIGVVLKSPPARIQMWFSENLNPPFSTSSVVLLPKSSTQGVTGEETRVDLQNASVNANNAREMDLSLKPNLSPGVYLVFYRTQSTVDGHIASDSFLFTVAEPDGTVPTYKGTLPAPPIIDDTLETTNSLDFSTIFSGLMATLFEAGIVFWVGVQLWVIFVCELTEIKDLELLALDREVRRYFEHVLAIPILLLLLVANSGILLSQTLALTGGQWLSALAPSLLWQCIANPPFGTYWSIREIVLVLVLVLTGGQFLKRFPSWLTALSPWLQLGLGLILLIAVTLSGHAAAVDGDIVVGSVLIDWLHLLAASLWVGGIFYLVVAYLPVLRGKPFEKQVQPLLTLLSRYSPLALTGVILMAISGPSNAAIHLPTWSQLFTTAYGCILLSKTLLVMLMICSSAVHVFWLRPHLKKHYEKYKQALAIGQQEEKEVVPLQMIAKDVTALERSLQQKTGLLIGILRWEALLGIAVLLCSGLLSIFAGTLLPAALLQPAGDSFARSSGSARPVVQTIQTTDGLFTAMLTVSPNHQGPNAFTLHILKQPSISASQLTISIDATQPGMDMGIVTVHLRPDEKGNFTGNGNFSMSGKWRLSLSIRTPDAVFHRAQIEVYPT
ncbi:MAG TPA: copper resistance protein CopC [Ktedonobacteraceae bacterium]|nr:copper resistance protein CopC [Ktedonobacteraceae bacterium]